MVEALQFFYSVLKQDPAYKGMLPMFDANGNLSVKPPYTLARGENDGFGVFRYDSAVEAGNSFRSWALCRGGIHYLRFNTSSLTYAPPGWMTYVANRTNDGNAVLFVLPTGSNGVAFRMLIPTEAYRAWVSNVELNPGLEWVEMPGLCPVQRPEFAALALRNVAGNMNLWNCWINNRRSANPLETETFANNNLYLSPVTFPRNLMLQDLGIMVESRSAITSTDKAYVCIYEMDEFTASVGKLLGMAEVSMSTWANGPFEGRLKNYDGVAVDVQVSSHRVYWVGFVVIGAAGSVVAKALPLSDAFIIAGGINSSYGTEDTPSTCFVHDVSSADNLKFGFAYDTDTVHMTFKKNPLVTFHVKMTNSS